MGGQTLILGVQARANQTDIQVNKWIKSAIISSDSLRTIQRNRVLGIDRSVMQSDEGWALFQTGTIPYRLATDSEFFQPGEDLYVFNVADTEEERPLSIMLYVPDEASSDEKEGKKGVFR